MMDDTSDPMRDFWNEVVRRTVRDMVRQLDEEIMYNPEDAEAADILIRESGARPPDRKADGTL